jgi:hypothetical protein
VLQVDRTNQGDPLDPIALTLDLDGDGTLGPLTAFAGDSDLVDPADGLVGAVLSRNSIDPGTSFFTSSPGGVGDKANPGMFGFTGGGDGLFPTGFGSSTGGGTSTGGNPSSVMPSAAPSAGNADSAPPPSPSNASSSSAGTTSENLAESGDATGDEEDATYASEDEREYASDWACPSEAPSAYQSTPADAAFGNDARGNPYSVDPFCGDYALVGVVKGSDERYGGLSYAAGDFWVDSAQARSVEPIPPFQPTGRSAVASGPPGDDH